MKSASSSPVGIRTIGADPDRRAFARLGAAGSPGSYSGTVILQATISKEGSIENLQLISGHPMLAPAAIEAVKQWKYKPYLLNGEPVEVETQVQVNFTLAGG